MSYILYECSTETVAIKSELTFLRNYIDLEKYRYENRVEVTFFQETDDDSLKIAPLLFIAYIENAFKYGLSNDKNNIDIRLVANAGVIDFYIENNYTQHETGNNNQKRGIGIENVKRRLELLYPKHYELNISSDDNIFRVQLKIDTNGNQLYDNRR